MAKDRLFHLSSVDDIQALLEHILLPFTVKQDTAQHTTLSYYDTFDWRLYQASLVLFRLGDQLCLRPLARRKILYQLEAADSPPGFVWEFPKGQWRKTLAPILKSRALLTMAEVEVASTTFELVNEAEEIVTRLICRSFQPESNGAEANEASLRVQPMPGYKKAAKAVAGSLVEAGLVPAQVDDLYFRALQANDKQPAAYSIRLDFQLEPAMRADESVRLILRFLFKIIEQNRPYIKQDIDTEFLHDFRVALRRTRTALGQLKGVFPIEVSNHYHAEFARLGKMTNELRDLDVYLLSEAAYIARLPPVLHEALEPLFQYLRQKRKKVLKTVVAELAGAETDQLFSDWAAFLAEPTTDSTDLDDAPAADQPISAVARRRIYKRYRRVLKAGRQIVAAGDEGQMHALRLDCKKLRYLLEFFRDLFPGKPMARLIKQLSRLHDNLGEFHDLAVQENYLQIIAAEFPLRQRQARQTLLAIGSLVEKLDAEKEAAKVDFEYVFAEFDSAKTRSYFKKLFAG